jgi:hypothetical protein
MRRAVLAVFLAVAVCAPPPAAAADRPPDRCAKPDSRTVRSNASIRVYRLHSVLWGCRQRTGRTMLLDDALHCSSTACIGSDVAATNGRWVVLVEPGPEGVAVLGETAHAYLRVADVVGRRKRLVYVTEVGPGQYGQIPDVAITPGGRLAWMAEVRFAHGQCDAGMAPSRSIHVAGPSGQFVVDEGGFEIGEGSLAISGTRAYWMHGDEPRTAVLP